MKSYSVGIVSAALLAFTTLPSYAGTCHSVAGVVTSFPDPACQVENEFPQDQADWYLPGVPNKDRCFTVIGLGTAAFRGAAGLTTVPVADVNGGVITTPLGFPPVPPFPNSDRGNLTGFTSQAVLTGRLKGLRGSLYTKDTGYIVPDPDPATGAWVGQVLIIVGGTGGFENATGTISVAGKEVGGWANYSGFVCEGDR